MNGKIRSRIIVAADSSDEELKRHAGSAVTPHVGGSVQRISVVPRKLVSIVVG